MKQITIRKINPMYRRLEMVFRYRTSVLIALVTILLIAIGCSGSGSQTPITPSDIPDITFFDNTQKTANNAFVWEVGEVVLFPETGEAEVTPLRTADFSLNVVKFLQPPSGNPANLSVTFDMPNSDLANQYVELDVNLTHPFAGTNLWGFDTRVIVFGGGSTVGKHDSSVKYPLSTELRIVNADGYTRWWNREEFAPFNKIFGYTDGILATPLTANPSTVNGYKYFATGITSQTMPPNPSLAGRGSFASGTLSRRFKLQFPHIANPYKFKYSIGSNWEAPTNNPPSSAADFPLTANQQEAYQIVVTQDASSTAFYDPDDGTFGGDLNLTIEVWDWQAAGNPAGQITGIWVESPTLLSNQGNVVQIKGTWTESAGSTANSVKYTGTLSNVTPTAVTNQELLITVESAGVTSYAPPATGFLYPDKPLAAYQLFLPTILDAGTPPTKSITVTSPNGGEILAVAGSHNITWTWTGSITNVVIEYSTDGGATYPNVIVASTPCDGSHTWSPIPDTPTTTAKVRITEAGAPTPATDTSDNNFTIQSGGGEPGWNPVPGQTGITVNNPAPNQSTVTPDLGIQNDNAGAEGAWIIDQEGGIADGSPYFVDYLLDWSGPGGNEYPSGFNYNFAPMGRFDASSNGVALFGMSGKHDPINPPVINDSMTSLWYISYLKADEVAVPGDLYYVIWGDEGTGDPPGNDPDAQAWALTHDVSSGLPGVQGTNQENATTFVGTWANGFSGAPPVPNHQDGSSATGDLLIGSWWYPYLTSNIWRLPILDFTTELIPPKFEAMDVSDKSKIRIACDSDSYLTFDDTLNNLANLVYVIDSLGNIYGSGYQLFEPTPGSWSYYYIGLGNSPKIRTTSPLYVSGGKAVDLEVLPRITYTNMGTDEWNWLAVLFDMQNNTWVVRVYKLDWAAYPDLYSEIDTTDPLPGTPIALDVDPWNFEIHVLAKDGSNIKATVLDYTE